MLELLVNKLQKKKKLEGTRRGLSNDYAALC
jgi:hypothetical protein